MLERRFFGIKDPLGAMINHQINNNNSINNNCNRTGHKDRRPTIHSVRRLLCHHHQRKKRTAWRGKATEISGTRTTVTITTLIDGMTKSRMEMRRVRSKGVGATKSERTRVSSLSLVDQGDQGAFQDWIWWSR